MSTNSEQSDTLARMSYSQEANCIAFASLPVDVLNIFEKRDITSITILQQIIVIIGSNLKLTLRLLFCPNSNNLLLKICCKNVVNISFLF